MNSIPSEIIEEILRFVPQSCFNLLQVNRRLLEICKKVFRLDEYCDKVINAIASLTYKKFYFMVSNARTAEAISLSKEASFKAFEHALSLVYDANLAVYLLNNFNA